MTICANNLWQAGLWQSGLWKGGLWGAAGINLDLYNFYVDFPSLTDKISGQLLTVALDATRYGYAGGVFGEDVPVIESGKLLTNGAYTQLIKESGDISGVSWNDINITVTPDYALAPDGSFTAGRAVATSVGHLLQQTIGSLTAGDQITFYFYAKNNGGTDAKLSIYDETNAANIIAPESYFSEISSVVWSIVTRTITVPVGCTTVRFYLLRDSGVLSDIILWGPQVTESPYCLPYAPNDTTGIKSVPLNYSDADEGIKAVGIAANFPQLHLALYGTDGTDAQGRMTIPWTPRFDYVDTSVNRNILSGTGGVADILYHTNSGQLKSYDQVNPVTPIADIDFISGTPYIIELIWGPHPSYANASKIQIKVTDTTGANGPWESAVVDFDGSFNPGDDFSIAWENPNPQEIGSIIIEKEPSW